MIFDRSDLNQSHFMQALVPMVDLFAVLAIVFMIHSNEEIISSKLESDKKIQEIVAEVEEAKKRLKGIDEAEQARRARREFLAKKANKTLEQIKEERERKAQELLKQVTEMLAAQQSQAAMDYENILARIEHEYDEELEKEAISLEKDKQAELEKRKAELEKQRQLELARAEQAFKEQAEREAARLKKEKELALAKAEQEGGQKGSRTGETKATGVGQDRAGVQRASRTGSREIEKRERARISKSRTRTTGCIGQSRTGKTKETGVGQGSASVQRASRTGSREIEKRERARISKSRTRTTGRIGQKGSRTGETKATGVGQDRAGVQRASRTGSREIEKREAEQEGLEALAKKEAELEKEKAKALSEKEKAFTDKLGQQKQLLAKVAEELTPYVQALEAKNKIVEELNKNFKDFDPSAVEIDKKTGKVKLHFQQSYFARGSHKLSEDMKNFLRKVIPKYAKGIYVNKDAAEHVKSLKISGMTSPVYAGVYIDIDDKSPETERARKYNMALSNRRAKVLYDFIFDKDEMGDYEFRSRLKADMSIESVGFKHATRVPDHLVGKPAKCIEYDCQQERVTVLQFRVFSE
jgi:hypothetical protein